MNVMLSIAKSNMKRKDQKTETTHIYKAPTCRHISYKALQQVEQAPKLFTPWSLEPGKMFYSVEKGLCRHDLDYRHRIERTLELVGGRRDAAEGKAWEIPSVRRPRHTFAHLQMRGQLTKQCRWPQGAENGWLPAKRGSCLTTRKEGREWVNDDAIIQQIACDYEKWKPFPWHGRCSPYFVSRNVRWKRYLHNKHMCLQWKIFQSHKTHL